jgi:hypothetical protein
MCNIFSSSMCLLQMIVLGFLRTGVNDRLLSLLLITVRCCYPHMDMEHETQKSASAVVRNKQGASILYRLGSLQQPVDRILTKNRLRREVQWRQRDSWEETLLTERNVQEISKGWSSSRIRSYSTESNSKAFYGCLWETKFLESLDRKNMAHLYGTQTGSGFLYTCLTVTLLMIK